MNSEDINKMWLQSQDDAEGMRLGFTTQQHYFAALVAAAEREACINAVKKVGQHGIVTQCAAAIRCKKHDIWPSEERDRVWTQAHWTEYERSIAAAEREACAKLCEQLAKDPMMSSEIDAIYCAEAIRARSNA